MGDLFNCVNELSKFVLSGGFIEGDSIYVDTDIKGFTFNKKGFEGTGEKPEVVNKSKQNGKKTKRKKQVDDLMKAAKDVEGAIEEVGDGGED